MNMSFTHGQRSPRRWHDGRELAAAALVVAGFAALVGVNLALLARLLPAAG